MRRLGNPSGPSRQEPATPSTEKRRRPNSEPQSAPPLDPKPHTVNPRKLEHGFRRIGARIPYTLPSGHEDIDVPTFWLLL